jgi:hypothetical protein
MVFVTELQIPPNRSPSPLAFCLGHHPAGASQLTQSYTPNQSSINRSNSSAGETSAKPRSPKLQKAESFKGKDEKSSEK